MIKAAFSAQGLIQGGGGGGGGGEASPQTDELLPKDLTIKASNNIEQLVFYFFVTPIWKYITKSIIMSVLTRIQNRPKTKIINPCCLLRLSPDVVIWQVVTGLSYIPCTLNFLS